MTKDELDAIRERTSHRSSRCAVGHSIAEHASVFQCLTCEAQTYADIDALIAEVERLRNGHVVFNCACGHGPENHVVTRSCRSCPGSDVVFDGARHLPFEDEKHQSREFTAEYENAVIKETLNG